MLCYRGILRSRSSCSVQRSDLSDAALLVASPLGSVEKQQIHGFLFAQLPRPLVQQETRDKTKHALKKTRLNNSSHKNTPFGAPKTHQMQPAIRTAR